ncbi:hypothetical protein ACNKHM_24090 [Shigella sonnei]
MVDVHDKATRSKICARLPRVIRRLRRRLASFLTGQGLAFRVQDASLPGRRILSLMISLRVFTDGCSAIIITAIRLKCL